MSIQVVAGFYAIAKIGAIVVPIFSGFAAPAVARAAGRRRCGGTATADAVPRKGRPVQMKQIADDAAAGRAERAHVIVWDRLDSAPAMTAGRDHWWHDAVAEQPAALQRPALDPETPMMMIYTSGTTGRPKGAVHVHGGFLVKIAEECAFQTDVGPDDRFMWVTDMGWIMGPMRGGRRRRARARRWCSARARPTIPARAGCGSMVERHRISGAGRLADADPGARAARRRAGAGATTARRCAFWPRPASRGTPSPTAGCTRSAARAAAPIINLSGGTEVAACFL